MTKKNSIGRPRGDKASNGCRRNTNNETCAATADELQQLLDKQGIPIDADQLFQGIRELCNMSEDTPCMSMLDMTGYPGIVPVAGLGIGAGRSGEPVHNNNNDNEYNSLRLQVMCSAVMEEVDSAVSALLTIRELLLRISDELAVAELAGDIDDTAECPNKKRGSNRGTPKRPGKGRCKQPQRDQRGRFTRKS